MRGPEPASRARRNCLRCIRQRHPGAQPDCALAAVTAGLGMVLQLLAARRVGQPNESPVDPPPIAPWSGCPTCFLSSRANGSGLECAGLSDGFPPNEPPIEFGLLLDAGPHSTAPSNRPERQVSSAEAPSAVTRARGTFRWLSR